VQPMIKALEHNNRSVVVKILFVILNEWLLLAICLAIVLAYIFPAFGSDGGPLNPNLSEDILVAIVFFCSGLIIKPEQLKDGLLSWPSHLIIQFFIFVVFPCFVYGFVGLFSQVLPASIFPHKIATGIIITDTLPTTITMAPIFTQASKGDMTVALVNASLSSLLSIFLCPFLVLLQLGSDVKIDFLNLIIHLVEVVVAPILGGLILQFLMGFTEITKKIITIVRTKLGIVNKFCLIILTYLIFCGTFIQKQNLSFFSGTVLATMTAILFFFHVLQLLLLFGFQVLIRAIGIKFSRPTIVAQIIVASQKTMTMAIPLIKAIFASNPTEMGIATLPVVIYHSIETIFAGILVSPFSKWIEQEEKEKELERKGNINIA